MPTDEKTKKEKLREKRRKKLINAIALQRFENNDQKAAFILNNNVKARSSDIEFIWDFWSTFENEHMENGFITKKSLFKLSKFSTLARVRRKVQNELNLFHATPEVQAFRKKLAHTFKSDYEPSVSADLPFYRVFIDESGKTGDFLCVGSVWNYKTSPLQQKIEEWKKENDITYEFHFSTLKKQKLDNYKEFISKALQYDPYFGFKVIIVNRTGIRDIQKAITDLTYHLVAKGIKQDDKNNRAPLPRLLQVYIDGAEPGADQLKKENISDRLKSAKISGLTVDYVNIIDSKESVYIQLVDLLVASINRKLNIELKDNHKDRLASFVLDVFNFDLELINRKNSQADNAEVFNLSDFKSAD